jgi:protein-disulfide isomerase
VKWDSALTVILIACALITTGLVVHREFFAASMTAASAKAQKPVFIENWQSQLDKGVHLGPSAAAVQLMEFADFECPFCATFHQTLQQLRERYPRQIALSYVHYPLPMHRFAAPAARAAECADRQGRFEAIHDRLYEEQAQFGLKSWSDYASAAGVPERASFETCMESVSPIPRVESGKQLAVKLGVQGTPTLIVNGWKLGQPPTLEELDAMVKAILAGRSPIIGIR